MEILKNTIAAFAVLDTDNELLDDVIGKKLEFTAAYKSRCQELTNDLNRKLMPALTKRSDLGDWYIEFAQLSVEYPKYKVEINAENVFAFKEISCLIANKLDGAELDFKLQTLEAGLTQSYHP